MTTDDGSMLTQSTNQALLTFGHSGAKNFRFSYCDTGHNNNNNNNAICIAQIRRKQQMGCGQCPKRKAFSLALNVSIDMSVDRKSFGRLFHTEGPWTEKLRSP